MTTEQAREVFNQVAAEQTARGDQDAVARTELLREWFCNPEFRKAMADKMFNEWSR